VDYYKNLLIEGKYRRREAENNARKEASVYVEQYEKQCAEHYGAETSELRLQLAVAQEQNQQVVTAVQLEQQRAVHLYQFSMSLS
jgi:hypothetical protein